MKLYINRIITASYILCTLSIERTSQRCCGGGYVLYVHGHVGGA